MIEAPAPVLTIGERSRSPSRLLIAQQPSDCAAVSVRLAIASARVRRMILPPEIRAAVVQETCAGGGSSTERPNGSPRQNLARRLALGLRISRTGNHTAA